MELKSIPEMAFESLVEEIRDFQAGLPNTMEVGIAAAGMGTTLHVTQLHLNGQMIVFHGTDAEDREARLIQHYSLTSVQMLAVGIIGSEPRRIGF